MSALDHAGLMDQVYRRQRHFYDITRKFYLLGRDPMLAGLDVPAGGSVLEIGCGTGRNIVRAARLYPDSRLFGIDISGEMLRSAGQSIANERLHGRVRLALADAATFDAEKCFGQPAFDRIFISYSLSMIPEWRSVVHAAARRLTPGGRLHVVDFGNQERLPDIARALLLRWLAMFDVTPRDDLEAVLAATANSNGADLAFERPFRGYAQYAVLTLPAAPKTP